MTPAEFAAKQATEVDLAAWQAADRPAGRCARPRRTMANRNELFLLAARYKVSAAHFSKLYKEATIAGLDMSTTALLQANAPAVFAAVDRSNADQFALLEAVKALPDLQMFLIGDSDYVVALDAADAWDLWRTATGCDPAEVDSEYVTIASDRPLSCLVDADGEPTDDSEGSTKMSRTAGEWAALLGPGFAFSENY